MRSWFYGIAFAFLTLVFAGCATATGGSSSASNSTPSSSASSSQAVDKLTEQGVKPGIYYTKVGF